MKLLTFGNMKVLHSSTILATASCISTIICKNLAFMSDYKKFEVPINLCEIGVKFVAVLRNFIYVIKNTLWYSFTLCISFVNCLVKVKLGMTALYWHEHVILAVNGLNEKGKKLKKDL